MTDWHIHSYDNPPDPSPVFCPECGEECTIIYTQAGNAIGCENCITTNDAYEWEAERE